MLLFYAISYARGTHSFDAAFVGIILLSETQLSGCINNLLHSQPLCSGMLQALENQGLVSSRLQAVFFLLQMLLLADQGICIYTKSKFYLDSIGKGY